MKPNREKEVKGIRGLLDSIADLRMTLYKDKHIDHEDYMLVSAQLQNRHHKLTGEYYRIVERTNTTQ